MLLLHVPLESTFVGESSATEAAVVLFYISMARSHMSIQVKLLPKASATDVTEMRELLQMTKFHMARQ